MKTKAFISVGSVCSGIEAASVALKGKPYHFNWFSEIAAFPSRVLEVKYPNTPNLGDMNKIPDALRTEKISPPDMICGGTPCQAFSLAGWKKGLLDDRGNLTLKFVEIIKANDSIRKVQGLPGTIVLWENVEGVLRDKTNAFESFISSLAGFDSEISFGRLPTAGYIKGPEKNVAWRVLDAKYFGLPQQRRRLYVLAGDRDFSADQILFEKNITSASFDKYPKKPLASTIEGVTIEVFREYTDCLYSAYGTKWNGNAAAYNGSLFVYQNSRLRRLTPLECERLMGFPDDYTKVDGWKPTNRYQAVGNSWAVPVIEWIGERIAKHTFNSSEATQICLNDFAPPLSHEECPVWLFAGKTKISGLDSINSSHAPNNQRFGDIFDFIEVSQDERYFITPVGCKGILRRKDERGMKINSRLEEVLRRISSQLSDEEIEKISRKQTRGRFSNNVVNTRCDGNEQTDLFDMSIFDL
jgi:DNA (cytosine-5)-methyltransferase 1